VVSDRADQDPANGDLEFAGHTTVDEAPGPERSLEHWQQLMLVREALDRLDSRCRELLQAVFSSDSLGYDHLSRQLNMPVGSIGPTRARCLAKLRRLLE
jgi:DNA-directed RNA polymerase specialized sigma24 family protein